MQKRKVRWIGLSLIISKVKGKQNVFKTMKKYKITVPYNHLKNNEAKYQEVDQMLQSFQL